MALSFLVPAKAPAADFELVGLEMTRLLQNGHYARLPFNEEMSARFLSLYLDTIDREHCYFLAAEIADFRKNYSRILHDLITSKDVMPVATGIFEIYRSRVSERADFVKAELAKGPMTFTSDRSVAHDRSKVDWPADSAALEQLWRDQLGDMLLTEIVRREELVDRAAELAKPVPFQNGGPTPEEKVLGSFERLVRTIESAEEEDIANYFFSAVARAHDPHSEYLSANELEQFKIDVSNELVGIGARLLMNDAGETEIRGIVNGGPADRKGELQLGDRIIAVSPEDDDEWIDITFKPTNRVIEHILGEEGSAVGLRLNREVGDVDQTIDLTIERGVVTMKGDLVTSRIYEYGEGETVLKLAVMRIPSFYFDFDNNSNRVSVDVLRMLERLKKENIGGLALDLRGNGGGSLPEVQRLTGFFVGRGPVVQVKSINGTVEPLDSLNRKSIYEGPMLILIDKGSASATEILAGALQDYRRAVVVGSTSTYGKGTVQKTMDIGNYMPILADRERAGWLKLTFQKYYRVSGSSVQIKGVIPDLILPALSDSYESTEGEEDYALPHDVIRKSPDFRPLEGSDLHLAELQEKSRVRVAGDRDFAYLREDIERGIGKNEKNSISLNLETRVNELHEDETRRKTRNEEREERFARMELEDAENFKIYRLTMDNLDAETLPFVDLLKDEDEYIRSAVDELDELEIVLKWPSGIDAVKREGLRILQDLVIATQLPPVAVALPRKGR